jgi:hypothetical protein
LVEGIDGKYISKCLYHPDNDPLCPIMRLGDIVKFSGFNFTTIAKVVSRKSPYHLNGLKRDRALLSMQRH